jgi:hypothetical protein
MDAQSLGFADRSFDTVILKESLHHLVHETDIKRVMEELVRVTRYRVIVFDPNPTRLLRFCRSWIGHEDPECPFSEAKRWFEAYRFHCSTPLFLEGFALALSGGYIGREWIPPWKSLYPLCLKADQAYNAFVNFCGGGEQLLWRYLFYADLTA